MRPLGQNPAGATTFHTFFIRITTMLPPVLASGPKPCRSNQRDQINSLRNGRDSDLKQTENAFKDPEDGFWENKCSGYRRKF